MTALWSQAAVLLVGTKMRCCRRLRMITVRLYHGPWQDPVDVHVGCGTLTGDDLTKYTLNDANE